MIILTSGLQLHQVSTNWFYLFLVRHGLFLWIHQGSILNAKLRFQVLQASPPTPCRFRFFLLPIISNYYQLFTPFFGILTWVLNKKDRASNFEWKNGILELCRPKCSIFRPCFANTSFEAKYRQIFGHFLLIKNV